MPDFATPDAWLILWIAIGYLLGSIPFGLVSAWIFGLGDVRKIGSGNIGATNVLRTGHKPAAALTLLLDAGKGAAAVLITRAFAGEDAVQLAALAAFLGHCFPVWLKFKGGKGVATFLGIWLALAPAVGLACCATWLVAVALSRISSVGALAAGLVSPIWALLFWAQPAVDLAVVLALLIIARHWQNIQRLRTGSEPRIGARRK
ncbi:MAG: acyl-phosphate glycerol 3-phosphate acyltransferase [Rhodobacteraceae bacterium]|nr:acyl-phosphate glycerol 3-phosphate acyltransferase [Paracoccaceae bacterium]MAY44356.1 acyl-phosphate glycerol 3-phosphate acyltransferase [Paracoccaceae bacterium]QEW18742.1 G3P acyltransferase [Marinibacterium anthonyi]